VTTERVIAFARSRLGEDNRATLMYDRALTPAKRESGAEPAVGVHAEVAQ